MDHLTISPSRSFFLSTLYATVISVASLNGEISWSMETPHDHPKINFNMGPEDFIEAVMSTLPEDQHMGAYLEDMGPSNPLYGVIYGSFATALAKKKNINLREWKEDQTFEMVSMLGLRSPFLMPGLMQALKDNTTIQTMDVSGIPLTDIDEECIADILKVNSQIKLIRNHKDFHKPQVFDKRSESLRMAMDQHSEFFYPSLKMAMDTLERLNLDIWMRTPLMIDAKSQGISSPFFLPGFVRALRENKTIKTIDCRGYKLTNLESDYIDQILSIRKEIKVLKDSDVVSLSSENNNDFSIKSNSKKLNNQESASIEVNTPKIIPISFLNESLHLADDSLEDLERSFRNKEIDIDTYEMLKKEFSPEEVSAPVAEDSRNYYQAHKSLFDSMDCLKLKEIMNVGMMAGLESVGITSIFMFPDFVRALQDNKTIKTIDIRDYPITQFEINQINQVLAVNKNIKLIPDINLSEIITKGESALKSTGKKYQKLAPLSTEMNVEEIVHNEGEKLKSKLKEDYESGKIDLDTYNLWMEQVERVKLEGQTTKEQLFEKGALDIQNICLENNNSKLNYQGVNVNENFILDVLVRLIRMDTFLTHLNFNTCQIDDLGAIVLADALKENKTILHLDLRNNQIGPMGAAAFMNLFGSSCFLERKPCLNYTLKTLQLEGNPISREMIEQISRRIKGSKLTKSLDKLEKSVININIIEIPAEQVNETPK